MNKIAHYLQQHVSGEILDSPSVLDYFSTDESILRLRPSLVLYPRSENDVRKTARFTWQLAEKGKVVPVTARGMGTDQTGASLGSGIIVSMPAHMNRVIEFDSKTGVIVAESGISLDKLQQVLLTHGRFLPPVSEINKYATLGGAVANNDKGRASYKYGPMLEFVQGLRVVLANGELIETGRLSKREFGRKLGLASFEGDIYRSIDKIMEESSGVIQDIAIKTDNSPAGYNVADVIAPDGSVDLTPLFVGAQGTLGIITEVTLKTVPYNPQTTHIVAGFAERAHAWQAVAEMNAIKDGPFAIDFVDKTLLSILKRVNPAVLEPLEGGEPAVLLFIDLDDDSRSGRKVKKRVLKILESQSAAIEMPEEDVSDEWRRLRDSASIVLTHVDSKKQAIPVLDDAFVPVSKIPEFFEEFGNLMKLAGVGEYAAWGQAGTGLVHMAPLLDIASVGDRQKMFKVMDAYYSYVCKIGGSIAGEYGEGRTRGLFIDKLFSPEELKLLRHVRDVFNPAGTLNPGVKFDVKINAVRSMVRDSYALDHQYAHLPRS